MLLGGLPLVALSAAQEGSELGPRLQQLTGVHSSARQLSSIIHRVFAFATCLRNVVLPSHGALDSSRDLASMTLVLSSSCLG